MGLDLARTLTLTPFLTLTLTLTLTQVGLVAACSGAHISLHLPTSPYISVRLPISPPYLPGGSGGRM